jgi:hypothetical protein
MAQDQAAVRRLLGHALEAWPQAPESFKIHFAEPGSSSDSVHVNVQAALPRGACALMGVEYRVSADHGSRAAVLDVLGVWHGDVLERQHQVESICAGQPAVQKPYSLQGVRMWAAEVRGHRLEVVATKANKRAHWKASKCASTIWSKRMLVPFGILHDSTCQFLSKTRIVPACHDSLFSGIGCGGLSILGE